MLEGSFVIKNNEDNFIGLDKNSGGYPFVVFHPDQIRWWLSREDAEAYISHWPNDGYSIFEVKQLVLEGVK